MARHQHRGCWPALPAAAQVYCVGGAVRDSLLGRQSDDQDFVVVGATPEVMLAAGFRPGMGQFIPDRFFWARGPEEDDASHG